MNSLNLILFMLKIGTKMPMSKKNKKIYDENVLYENMLMHAILLQVNSYALKMFRYLTGHENE